MLLEHIGEPEAARAVVSNRGMYQEKQVTKDMGGSSSTSDVGDAKPKLS